MKKTAMLSVIGAAITTWGAVDAVKHISRGQKALEQIKAGEETVFASKPEAKYYSEETLARGSIASGILGVANTVCCAIATMALAAAATEDNDLNNEEDEEAE